MAVCVSGILGGREFNVFDQWTAGLLRKCADRLAAAGRMAVEDLVNACISSAWTRRDAAKAEEHRLVELGQHWKQLLELRGAPVSSSGLIRLGGDVGTS